MNAPAEPEAVPQFVAEPVLDMDDIQGIAVPGFLKPHQTLLHIRMGRASARKFRAFVRNFGATTAARTLADRRHHRGGSSTKAVLRAIGFTSQGLQRLVPSAATIPSPAFRVGMAGRSTLLGDPADPGDPGHASNWTVGGAGRELDVLIVLAGDERPEVSQSASDLATELAALGVEVDSQDGDIRSDLRGHEHFGFDDGVSQPGIRGRASSHTHDHVTPRHMDAAYDPVAAALFGYPGQDLVWPGEFVLGYPATGPDPLRPGPIAEPVPDWTRNGSFLVYRRLRQDVALFWNWIGGQRKMLEAGGAKDLDDITLASRLVGRWPSGAPFNRAPKADNEKIGGDKFENNNFLYNSDTPDLKFRRGHGKPPEGTRYPDEMAKADPVGITCPWAAHIRKVNTRDSPSDVGATTATYARRLLRVGVPYGPPIADRYRDDGVDRGLLFLSIQSSIEEQFEFLQSRWMNDLVRPKAPAGNDMLVGQNAPTEDGRRRCILFRPDGTAPATLEAEQQWVLPRGGGYFFLPSLTALRDVVGGQ